MENAKVFASSSSWIESNAVDQLRLTQCLPGMKEVVGLPDLHISKNSAVGTAAYSEEIIYPHLIGNDSGCGFSLFKLSIKAHKFNAERAAQKLVGLDGPWGGDVENFLLKYNVKNVHPSVLGTVGGGNHFAEIQKIVEVADEDAIKNAFLDPEQLVLLVHSGSRSLGEEIWRKWSSICKTVGLQVNSKEFEQYMKEINVTLPWASANRALIALRICELLDCGCDFISDVPHNFIEPYRQGFLHRKGSAPSNRGLSPLPGSRGSPTYLLKPTSDIALASLAHGAGRKISRSNMHDKELETNKAMLKSKIGSVLVCGDEQHLREEHPKAYKDVSRVLADLKEHNLATDVATFHPVLTYKSEMRRDSFDKRTKREKEESWRDERRMSQKRKI